jgi:hypothetical protein
MCSDRTVLKKFVALALLSLLGAACSSGSTASVAPSASTHPIEFTLSNTERFFNSQGATPTGWSQGAREKETGPLHGLDTYTGGASRLSIDVIGNPADETELSVDDAIASAADSIAANAVMLATVQHFAPGAVAWIRGALAATDGTAGYFGGSSSTDTSGHFALSFNTSGTNHHGLHLVLRYLAQ